MSDDTVHPNPDMIKMWATRTKCAMCKHTKDKGHILPEGTFHPSPAWTVHYADTHGFPADAFRKYIWNSVYGLPTTEKDIFGINKQTEAI